MLSCTVLLLHFSDIEFEMPFHNSGKTNTNSSSYSEEEEDVKNTSEVLEDEADDGEEREEATSFLANLGVETSQFPNLNPSKVNM